MNAKSKLTVKYAEGVIEMNTTFAKMMQNPLSEEYALLPSGCGTTSPLTSLKRLSKRS